MRKVRITKVPKARAGGQSSGYTNTVPEQLSNYGGADVGEYKIPDISTRRTLQPVDWEDATIEAEKGEVAYGDINGDKFSETYVIGGKRHSDGGTPLNLPAGTFIYSDFNEMKIKDPNILAMFGKEVGKKRKSKKGYTPATLAKQYDINKYRMILDDKDSDKHDRETAQIMIEEYQDKLAALALAQESMKNFEQGIPQVAMPYLQKRGLQEQDIMPTHQMPDGTTMPGATHQEQPMMAQQGGWNSVPNLSRFIPVAQKGVTGNEPYWQKGINDVMSRLAKHHENEGLYGKGDVADEFMYAFPKEMRGEGQPANTYNLQDMGLKRGEGYPIPSDMFGMQEYLNAIMNEQGIDARSNMPLADTSGAPFNQPNYGPIPTYERPATFEDVDVDPRNAAVEDMKSVDLMKRVNDTIVNKKGGGSIQKYQKKGEVTYKTYEETDLPEGTVIMDYYSPFTKVGDYVRLSDGTIRKVKSKGVEQAQSTQTATGTIADYTATTEGKSTVDRANQIIEQGIKDGTIKKLGNGNIRIMGDFSPSFRDRIILSRALNASGKKFGTDKYKVAKQSFTKGYSKAGKAKGSGNFVAGFTPEDYEKRFMFELMTGSGADDETAFNRIDEIYTDPTRKAQARKMYLQTIGVLDAEGKKDGKEYTDDELLSDDFYKQNYADVTKGVESTLGESGFRPVIGNEQLSGFEHFDALGIRQPLDYEGEEAVVEEGEDEEVTVSDPLRRAAARRAPWWLQDEVNIAGNVIDRSRIKKYLPWAAGVDLEEADPTFTDPTFDANLATAGAAALMQGMGQFAGPQSSSARALAMQGNLANTVAGAISRHNTQNVGTANQFEQFNVGIRNQERMLRRGVAQQLYDQNTIANQQFDNSMLQLRREGRGLYNQAVTNRWKTDALNQMYPDYAVDPSVGGQMAHVPNYRDPKPTTNKDFNYWLDYYRQQGMADKEAINAAKSSLAGSSGGYMGADLDILNQQYGQEGGFVMGSTVFPFMFY
jgi:hypothetical protein